MRRLLASIIVAALVAFSGTLYAADKDAKGAAKPAAVQTSADAKIDINRAKAEELMKLDGIGEARAKAIIKGRPYKGKDELVEKKIIPQAVYDKIKDGIIARQK